MNTTALRRTTKPGHVVGHGALHRFLQRLRSDIGASVHALGGVWRRLDVRAIAALPASVLDHMQSGAREWAEPEPTQSDDGIATAVERLCNDVGGNAVTAQQERQHAPVVHNIDPPQSGGGASGIGLPKSW